MIPKKWEQVDWFAEEHMKRRLDEHEPHKRGWSTMAPAYLANQLGENYKQLCGAVDVMRFADDFNAITDSETIITKAADVANFAMMLADNARRIVLEALREQLDHPDKWDEAAEPTKEYPCDDCPHPPGSTTCLTCDAGSGGKDGG